MSFEHSTSSLQEDTPKNQNSEEILAIAEPEEIAAIKEKKISKKVDVKNIVKHKMEELISDIETSEMHKKRLE